MPITAFDVRTFPVVSFTAGDFTAGDFTADAFVGAFAAGALFPASLGAVLAVGLVGLTVSFAFGAGAFVALVTGFFFADVPDFLEVGDLFVGDCVVGLSFGETLGCFILSDFGAIFFVAFGVLGDTFPDFPDVEFFVRVFAFVGSFIL